MSACARMFLMRTSPGPLPKAAITFLHHARMLCTTCAVSGTRTMTRTFGYELRASRARGGGMCRSKRRARAPAHMASVTLPGLPGMMARLLATPFALSVLWNHHSLPVNDTLPGAENVRRTEARGLGTGAEDRQSMRYSTANHHVSSAHDARTPGGRGARAPFTPHWQLPHQAPTMVVHDARAAPKRPAHINHWYGLMRPGTLATAMPLGRAWEGSGT